MYVLCAACTLLPPPVRPTQCIPGGLTVTSNGTSSYCVGSSSQVVFDFAVTNDAPTVPVNYTITPTPATLTCTGTSRYNCPVAALLPAATLLLAVITAGRESGILNT
jgi:hypothetical protein